MQKKKGSKIPLEDPLEEKPLEEKPLEEPITDIISPAYKKTVLRSSLNVLKNDRSVRNIFGVFGVETSPEFRSAFGLALDKLDKVYKTTNNSFDRIFVEILKKYF